MQLRQTDMAKLGARFVARDRLTTPQLKAGPTALSPAPDRPLIIILHDIYAAHSHEGIPRGKRGEFYWDSTVADGAEVIRCDSQKLMGGDGIERNVASGSWLNVERVPLYSSNQAPKNGALSLGFRLIESDDPDEAKRIFSGISSMAKPILEVFTGGPAAVVTDAVVALVHALLALDEDDVAVAGIKGLLGCANHYEMGRFFSIVDKRYGDAAVFSVAPAELDPDFILYEPETVVGHQPVEVEVPKEGLLSISARTTLIPPLPAARCSVVPPEGPEKSFSFKNWRLRNIHVKPGPHSIVFDSQLPVSFDVSQTAFPLARDTGIF